MTNDLACIELVELVTDYLEQQLDDVHQERVRAHLADCEDCVARVAQMRTAIELTGHLEPDDVPDAVLDALADVFNERRAT